MDAGERAVERQLCLNEALDVIREYFAEVGENLDDEICPDEIRDRLIRRFNGDRESHQTPCLSALASGEACQPDGKRCAICGFIVDTGFAAEKPTVRMRP